MTPPIMTSEGPSMSSTANALGTGPKALIEAIRTELQGLEQIDAGPRQRIDASLDELQAEVRQLEQKIDLGKRLVRDDLQRLGARTKELLELREASPRGIAHAAPHEATQEMVLTMPRGWNFTEHEDEILVTAPGANPGGCHVTAKARSLPARLLHALARDLLLAQKNASSGVQEQ